MKRIIRLTESDIRRMVKRALFEERYGMNEFPPGLKLTDYAERWAAAVIDKKAGGPGVSEYKGKKYTIGDWMYALYDNYSGWAIKSIKKGIGKEISDITEKSHNIKTDEKGIKRWPDGRRFFASDVSNIYLQPENGEYFKDVFARFMYSEDPFSLQVTQEDLVDIPNPNGENILHRLMGFLATYAIHYWRKDLSQRFESIPGNFNFSNPVTHEKNVGDYEGMEADPDIMTHVQDANDEIENAIDDYTYKDDEDKNLERVMKRFKTYFKVILDDYNKNPENKRTISSFADNIQKDGTVYKRGRLIFAVRYLYDHCEEIFNHDMLVEFDKEVMKNVNTYKSGQERKQTEEKNDFIDNAYSSFIKKHVNEIIYKAYNQAVEDGDTDNYIIELFKDHKPKDFTSVSKLMETLWKNFKDPDDPTKPHPFNFGRGIKRQVNSRAANDQLGEAVSRAVNEAIRRLKRGSLYENRRRNRKRGLLF